MLRVSSSFSCTQSHAPPSSETNAVLQSPLKVGGANVLVVVGKLCTSTRSWLTPPEVLSGPVNTCDLTCTAFCRMTAVSWTCWQTRSRFSAVQICRSWSMSEYTSSSQLDVSSTSRSGWYIRDWSPANHSWKCLTSRERFSSQRWNSACPGRPSLW